MGLFFSYMGPVLFPKICVCRARCVLSFLEKWGLIIYTSTMGGEGQLDLLFMKGSRKFGGCICATFAPIFLLY